MKNLFLILFLFTGLSVSAQFVNNNKRIFNIYNYGAKGDGKQVYDGVTNGSTTFTSATASFTQADVGKAIRIPRGTNSAKAFVGTIATVSNSTTVLLNSAAAATTSSDTVTYGTDNTAAIQATIEACNTGGGGTIFIPNAWFIVAGALNTSYYGTNPNAQIVWPVTSFDSTSGTQNASVRRRFVIQGENPGLISLPVFGGKMSHTGPIIESLIDGTYQTAMPPSVFGTKSPDAGNFNLNANEIEFNGITIMVPTNNENGGPLINGINCYYSAGTSVYNCNVVIDGVGQASSLPTSENAGIILNQEGTELMSVCQYTTIIGFKYGLITSDHAGVNSTNILWCNYGRVLTRSFDTQHDDMVNVQWCQHLVYVPQTALLGGMVAVGGGDHSWTYFNIDCLDAEIYKGDPHWYNTIDIFSDSAGTARGNIYYTISQSGVGNTPITQNLFSKFVGAGDSVYCYNIGKPFVPPLTSTQVGYGSASNLLTGDAGLTYATSTGIVALSKNQNTFSQYSVTNTTAGTAAQARILMNSDVNGLAIGARSSLITGYGNLVANAGYMYSGGGPIAIMVDNNASFSVATGTAAPAATRFTIDGSGNFTHGIGQFGITEGSNGRVGQNSLTSGTKAITISGLTTSSRAFITVVSQTGTTTTTTELIGVCTANTLTVSAVTNAGTNTVNTLDTSTFNYFVINSMNDWIALAIVLGLIRPFFRRRYMVLKQAA